MPLAPSGTLSETPVRTLVEKVAQDRSTGTLIVRSGDDSYRLYFLFGQLFHALGPEADGEAAAVAALRLESGGYDFDSRAKLPAEETIKATVQDLVARADEPDVPAQTVAPPTAKAANGHAPQAELEPVLEAAGEPEVPMDEPVPAPEEAGVPSPAGPVPRARLTDYIPVPEGEVVYDQLKASFVDFSRLLQTLSSESHTGYLRLSGGEGSGLVLLHKGQVIEALFEGGQLVSTGRTGYRLVEAEVAGGRGQLDVVRLAPEIVVSLYSLVAAEPLYNELYASFVDLGAFIEFLCGRGLSGAVMVRSGDSFGVALLREGGLIGSFSSTDRDLGADATPVIEMGRDPEARIEVRGGGAVEVRPLDLGGGGASQRAKSKQAAPAAESADAEEEPAAPAAAEAASASSTDWGALIGRLNALADQSLQTRSKKVKEMLAATAPDREALLETIDRIAGLSMMFVDATRLARLAGEMRDVVSSTP